MQPDPGGPPDRHRSGGGVHIGALLPDVGMSVNAAIAGEGPDDIAFATAVGFRELTRVGGAGSGSRTAP